jgi:hypothetical protein
MVIDNF